MTRRVVVATMWCGIEEVGVVPDGQDDPTPEVLDAVAVALTAENRGVRPTVRVLEQVGPLVRFDDP